MSRRDRAHGKATGIAGPVATKNVYEEVVYKGTTSPYHCQGVGRGRGETCGHNTRCAVRAGAVPHTASNRTVTKSGEVGGGKYKRWVR